MTEDGHATYLAQSRLDIVRHLSFGKRANAKPVSLSCPQQSAIIRSACFTRRPRITTPGGAILTRVKAATGEWSSSTRRMREPDANYI